MSNSETARVYMNQNKKNILHFFAQPINLFFLTIGTLCSILMFHTLALHDDNIQILDNTIYRSCYGLLEENSWRAASKIHSKMENKLYETQTLLY